MTYTCWECGAPEDAADLLVTTLDPEYGYASAICQDGPACQERQRRSWVAPPDDDGHVCRDVLVMWDEDDRAVMIDVGGW